MSSISPETRNEPSILHMPYEGYWARHFRWVIYGLGPYIADYPEQVLLACVVQNWCPKCRSSHANLDQSPEELRSHEHTDTLLHDGSLSLQTLWQKYGIVGDCLPFTTAFPRADIHELLAPDLLHQIIKGTFKDHLVDWVEQYIKLEYGDRAPEILADIDRRIAVVPHFPGLRHFHEGRGFKQWTGDDSKGLMKVYLPAISGYVPPRMVQAVAALIEFCYLVRRSTIDEDTLEQIKSQLRLFHRHREIFRESLVRPEGFSLPRQHALTHYPFLISEFGAPNGLCSSITESLHIRAVKKPYRRSNRHNALGQMIITNQRLDKLKAARTYFEARGLINREGTVSGGMGLLAAMVGGSSSGVGTRSQREDEDDEAMDQEGAIVEPEAHAEVKLAKTALRKLPSTLIGLAEKFDLPQLPLLTRRFLYKTLNPDMIIPCAIEDLPLIDSRVQVFGSARAVFYAPSDISGLGGLRHERIRCKASWFGGAARRDCVFVGNAEDPDAPGFKSLLVARVFLFFSFEHAGNRYECALVHWFTTYGDKPCEETGLWRVTPDSIGAGDGPLPKDRSFTKWHSLDSFKMFYVNKYIDYHAHEVAF
ncbi:hypothetical protein NP233_g7656 [Leucocoprinus birnbaumii]|uniref:Uncharacterized protein n=1 Tax=Leucocoprinus birnbaumii TaxID=56174 RepID=A0AAD5YNS6_9AGAR|nr:hypothetical protein NP233_g7656 [Leucocoprinus birnbaumii]